MRTTNCVPAGNNNVVVYKILRVMGFARGTVIITFNARCEVTVCTNCTYSVLCFLTACKSCLQRQRTFFLQNVIFMR